MNNIRVLQYGKTDWSERYTLPAHITLDFYENCKEEIEGIYDLLIVDAELASEKDLKALLSCIKAYCVYMTENAQKSKLTKYLFEAKCAKRLFSEDAERFFAEDAAEYYTKPYGEKFARDYLVVNSGFSGTVEYTGSYNLTLTGDFGSTFRQAAYWKCTIPVFEGQCIDLYLEHETTGTVEIKLAVYQFVDGSVRDFQQSWEFSGEELKDVVRIDNKMGYGPVCASILAKGTGTLRIVSLHDRYSRKDFGFFLPGGDRYVTSKGEELFCYYDPGDRKAPLAFYFSGYRTQEGFEGYYMMRKLGCPFVLMTDPRLEGGAFYVGDREYERMVLSAISHYMKKVGARRDQVILSGSSMGTFGALYYGCDVQPYALILGKPLASMGNVAKNETLERVGGFPTALDVLLKEYGDISEEKVQEFNNRFWEKFGKAEWGRTKFIISYLYEDDYDPSGYPDILEHLSSSGVSVYGKGIHGHHNDNTDIVIEWFKSQYQKLLREDFKRGN